VWPAFFLNASGKASADHSGLRDESYSFLWILSIVNLGLTPFTFGIPFLVARV
jgi:hypothetical protein